MATRQETIQALEKVHQETGELLERIMEINQLIVTQRLMVPKLDYETARNLHLTSELMRRELQAKMPKPWWDKPARVPA